ncbi:calcium-binding protein [Cribrihabitans pelagius]|uniref:calcium-binding protein n=1 Tax=Cribrihabitans pelagius TaxID=1765746 RepID=UPI003B5AE6CE
MALAFTGRLAAEDLIFGTDLRDIEIAVQDGAATLYAITGMNGGISRWQLDAGGALAAAAGRSLHGAADLQTGGFQLAEAGGGLRLIREATSQGELAFHRLLPGGGLADQGGQALAGADAAGFAALTVAQLEGGKCAVYGTGAGNGRLQGWRLGGEGRAEDRTGAAGGEAPYQLPGATRLAVAETAEGLVLLAADSASGGLVSFRIDARNGALSPAAALGAAEGLAVAGITALEVFEADGQAWALLGAAGNGSLTLVQVGGNGALTFADQLSDTLATRFGGVEALEVVVADGEVLVLAAGADDGLSLLRMLPGGRLVHVESLANAAGLGLANVTALEAVVLDGTLQVFAASGQGGISQFSLDLETLGASRAAGAAREALRGTDGSDVLASGAGGGWLTGGAGGDVFVIGPAAGRVTIRDFTPGEDSLDLSLFAGLYSPAQLEARESGTSLLLQVQDTQIELVSGGGQPLTLEGVFGPALRFTFPHRQGLAPAGGQEGGLRYGTGGNDQLAGSRGSDRLDGLGGDDALKGGGGKDRLWGGEGEDRLWGGGKADLLWGGDEDDFLWGQGGKDRLWGGAGEDQLKGGNGKDRLWGGEADDRIEGQGGKDRLWGNGGGDRLEGGAGADKLWGGSGADVFVFARGHGRDRIADFTPGADLIDLTGLGRAAAQRFSQLEISRQDGGTLIDTGAGEILLEDLRPRQLDADDFLF